MPKKQVNNVNPSKLQDELLRSGLEVVRTESKKLEHEYIAEEVYIILGDGTDMEVVQQIIDAHDPTPLPPQPTDMEKLKQENDLLKAQITWLNEDMISLIEMLF